MSFYNRVYELVKKIPKGQVATYGQIAALAGHPRGARMVGWALHILNEEKIKDIPWQRVINREGRISTTCLEHTAEYQRMLLLNEGVEIKEKNGNHYIDLKKYRWQSEITLLERAELSNRVKKRLKIKKTTRVKEWLFFI